MSREIEAMVRRAELLTRDDQLEELFGDDLSHRLLRLVAAKKENRMTDTTPSAEKRAARPTPTGDPWTENRPKESGGPPPTKRGPWVPALAAAVVVALVSVGTLWFLRGEEPTPLATDADSIMSAAIAVAERYMEAYNAYDATRARALLAADVQINSPSFRDLEDLADIDKLEAVLQALEVIGFRYSPFQCDLSFRPADVRTDTFLWVLCDYEMDSRPQQIVGHPPIAGSFGLGIVAGVITRIDEQFPFAEWGPNVDEPFIKWLNSNHPEGFASIYGGTMAARYPRLTEEALALMSTYLDEYEAWARSQQR
jgi:hypothetical protein